MIHKTYTVKPEPKTSTKNTPKLFGLVLSGGASSRMGTDKGLVNYHGVPQQEYLYQLLKEVCEDVFLSIQEKQLTKTPRGFKTIQDQNICKGPFNGIFSAHEAHTDAAWLVLACDLPFINLEVLQQLVHERDTKKCATSFANPVTSEPEPLVCIWEPNGLVKALTFLEDTKNHSPKRFLMGADIKLVHPKDKDVLFNANSPSDYDFAKKKLEGQERG